MSVYTKNAKPYIQALARCISQDPTAMDLWQCAHIRSFENKQGQRQEAILEKMMEKLKDVDCDIVYCQNNDVLIISGELSGNELLMYACELTDAVTDNIPHPEITLYDLLRHWRTVRALLLGKPNNETAQPLPKHFGRSVHDFSETISLHDMFNEIQKGKNDRYPMHILLIEDDKRAESAIAACLKDKYALITAHDAQEAVMNYLIFVPDVVFMDISLLGSGSFATLKQIMVSDTEANMVMFSGRSYLDNTKEALNTHTPESASEAIMPENFQQYIPMSNTRH